MKTNIKEKIHSTLEDIHVYITYPFVHLRFLYRTKYRPRKVTHFWCEFHDWADNQDKKGWYILDKRGNMIPWIHFDNDKKMICLYEHMIKPISNKE